VVAPSTVEEALKYARERHFDVLLSDWRLPDGYNGFDVFSEVRASLPNITCILISAEADEELTRDALAVGFDRVLTKAMEMSEIVGAVQACA
jgi:DNA-binding NarL/FixJ family response regulator